MPDNYPFVINPEVTKKLMFVDKAIKIKLSSYTNAFLKFCDHIQQRKNEGYQKSMECSQMGNFGRWAMYELPFSCRLFRQNS